MRLITITIIFSIAIIVYDSLLAPWLPYLHWSQLKKWLPNWSLDHRWLNYLWLTYMYNWPPTKSGWLIVSHVTYWLVTRSEKGNVWKLVYIINCLDFFLLLIRCWKLAQYWRTVNPTKYHILSLSIFTIISLFYCLNCLFVYFLYGLYFSCLNLLFFW